MLPFIEPVTGELTTVTVVEDSGQLWLIEFTSGSRALLPASFVREKVRLAQAKAKAQRRRR